LTTTRHILLEPALARIEGGQRPWSGSVSASRDMQQRSRVRVASYGLVERYLQWVVASRRRITRIACGVILALGAVLPVLAPTAYARRIRSPALGNWEGRGPHGLPLSFRFVRSHGHVDIRDLVIGYGLSCPAKRSHAGALAYMAGYLGPGRPSPFLNTFKIPANGFLIDLQGAMTFGTLEGRLKSRRRGKLWMSAPKNAPPCWPRKTDRWKIRRRGRRAVRDGTWAGSVAQPGAPSVTGTLTVGVAAQGRELDSFSLSYRCGPQGGGGGITTRPAYEFIDASGGFAGPATNQSVNGIPTTWSGRFGTDGVLRGTFSTANQCSPTSASTPVTLAFSARHV
jgi:hypothetical protein